MRALKSRQLMIVGIATDACITATAREAKDLGYEVTIVSDACATFERSGPGALHYPAERSGRSGSAV